MKITLADNFRIKKSIVTEILALLLEYFFYLFLAKDRQNANAHILGPTQL